MKVKKIQKAFALLRGGAAPPSPGPAGAAAGAPAPGAGGAAAGSSPGAVVFDLEAGVTVTAREKLLTFSITIQPP